MMSDLRVIFLSVNVRRFVVRHFRDAVVVYNTREQKNINWLAAAAALSRRRSSTNDATCRLYLRDAGAVASVVLDGLQPHCDYVDAHAD